MNEIRGRTLAHRYAMPTIGDMIETLSDSSILDVWSDVHIDNERALDFLVASDYGCTKYLSSILLSHQL